MDIWSTEKLPLFLMFVVPGFVSLKVWDLLVPGERRGFDSSLVEIVSYSALNFSALAWVIVPLLRNELNGAASLVAIVTIFVIFPTLWPIFWKWLRTRPWLSRFAIHPLVRPWDYVFSKREPAWIIVHLNDGSVVGGRYDERSFASSWPAPEQLYLEELWELDANRAFKRAIPQSRGAIILGADIRAIEFFEYFPQGD
ncbi:MAG: hypothetical protein HZB71_07370 [Betaproteobacteria bacterium]|nr:hypothetical protein [Betaproteobacteria bacterium]